MASSSAAAAIASKRIDFNTNAFKNLSIRNAVLTKNSFNTPPISSTRNKLISSTNNRNNTNSIISNFNKKEYIKIKPKMYTSYGIFMKSFFEKNRGLNLKFTDGAHYWQQLDARQKKVYEVYATTLNRQTVVDSLPSILRRYKFTNNLNVRRILRSWLISYCNLPQQPMSPYLMFCQDKSKSGGGGGQKLIFKRNAALNYFRSSYAVDWRNCSEQVRLYYKEKYSKNYRAYRKLHDKVIRGLDRKHFDNLK